MSHVRLVAPPENGTFVHSPSALCALTSENVTSSDFASLNGLSLIITVSDDGAPLGPVVESPHAGNVKAAATTSASFEPMGSSPGWFGGNGCTSVLMIRETTRPESLKAGRDQRGLAGFRTNPVGFTRFCWPWAKPV